MATRRGKTQARRNTGNGAGRLPGWAWMVLGIVLTVGVILAAPKFLRHEGGDGFFRPRPNPDAQPAHEATGEDDDSAIPEDVGPGTPPRTAQATQPAAQSDDYAFYDLLPGEEVAMTDAQLAAAAREEQARARRERDARAEPEPEDVSTRPQPLPETATATTAPAQPSTPAAPEPAPAAAAAGNDTPYILQAGAFGGSGDAETVKAKIAMLGLNARVESAQINGKTVYRVRMGPYGTASELAGAKQKLANGGLPALAIRAK